MARYLVNTARSLIFSTGAAAAGRGRRAGRAGAARGAARRVERLQATPTRCATSWPARASTSPARRRRSCRWSSARRRARCGCARRARAGRVRPGDPAADGPGGHVAAAARGHGVAHARGAARGRAGARPRRAARRASAPARACRRRGARRRAPTGARDAETDVPTRRLDRAAGVRGSSSPAPTPGSARPSSPAAIAAALRARGVRVAAFKPVVTGLDEPEPGGRADHELLGAARGAARRGRAAALRPGGLTAPGGGAGGHGHRAGRLVAAAAGAGAAGRRARRRGRRRAARPVHRRLRVRDLAVALGLPLVVAARPGSERSTTRC